MIVTLTTSRANERQIGYRNKHYGDTGGATLQGERGHRPWVTLSPLGRPSAGRNLGMGQGACRCLVLKTNLGPVIHKSLVYPRLETLQCTLHQSGDASVTPAKKKKRKEKKRKRIHVEGRYRRWLYRTGLIREWQALLWERWLQKWPESYINATLRFYFCPC